MFRGRGRGGPRGGGRGRGGAHLMHGVPPVQLKYGRGQSAKGNTTPKATTPAAKKAKKTKSSKPERDRDAAILIKPWVTEEMREEIKKKHEMHAASRKSEDPKDFEAFKEQRNKVTAMLRAAKLEYIGNHPEEDVAKIMTEATAAANAKVKELGAEAVLKTEKAEQAAENGDKSEPMQAEDGSSAESKTENGDAQVKTEKVAVEVKTENGAGDAPAPAESVAA